MYLDKLRSSIGSILLSVLLWNGYADAQTHVLRIVPVIPLDENCRLESSNVICNEKIMYTIYQPIGVNDGDTIKVMDFEGRKDRIRLLGVDCPEKNQPGGIEATMFTYQFVSRAPYLEAVSVARDRYHRLLGEVSVNQQSLTSQLVKNGLCWARTKQLRELQKEAKLHKRGIWAGDPIDPAKWRKRK